eukprot:954897-Pelagomonas_calceolata.AAC.6
MMLNAAVPMLAMLDPACCWAACVAPCCFANAAVQVGPFEVPAGKEKATLKAKVSVRAVSELCSKHL